MKNLQIPLTTADNEQVVLRKSHFEQTEGYCIKRCHAILKAT